MKLFFIRDPLVTTFRLGEVSDHLKVFLFRFYIWSWLKEPEVTSGHSSFNPPFFLQTHGHTWISTGLNDHFYEAWPKKVIPLWKVEEVKYVWQEASLVAQRAGQAPLSTHKAVLGEARLYLPFSEHPGLGFVEWKETLKLTWQPQSLMYGLPSPSWIVLNSVLPYKRTITELSLDMLWCNFIPGETEHYSWFTFSWTKHTHSEVRHIISLSSMEYYSILLLDSFLLVLLF